MAVVALGELARSPRMLQHARALAEYGCRVVLIGYPGRAFEMPAGVETVWIGGGSRPPEGTAAAIFLARSAWRMAGVFRRLRRALADAGAECILVQNPPSFPALAAAWLAARRGNAKLVIDWHNYGYSMLALRLGARHRAVRLAERYEEWAGRRAAAHFCVSEAMRADLARRGIRASVLYDRPAAPLPCGVPPANPRLLCVCPAGWTADEDIALLLDALESIAGECAPVTVHLTGDGPLRAAFEPRMAALRARGVLVTPGFLPESEYRALLRRADLGISVHRSSSGLDLAMKVVDLFGAGTPCCALAYGGSLPEQVEDGRTGFHFRDAAELASILCDAARHPETIAAMRRRVRECWQVTWKMEWDRVARPVLVEES